VAGLLLLNEAAGPSSQLRLSAIHPDCAIHIDNLPIIAGEVATLRGNDALCWAQAYMVTATQQADPEAVRYMGNVIAAIIEMSRTASGESIH
jgi:hypothetical protein